MAKNSGDIMKIAPDKRLHFFCTFIMNISLLIVLFLLDVRYGFIMANVFTALFWIGKEVYDCLKSNPTGFSWGDLLADLIGMIVANGIYMLLIA